MRVVIWSGKFLLAAALGSACGCGAEWSMAFLSPNLALAAGIIVGLLSALAWGDELGVFSLEEWK